MSVFIQPRRYTAREATLYQQPPAALIEAVEAAEPSAYPELHLLYGHPTRLLVTAGGPVAVVAHGPTAAMPYSLCHKSWSTTTTDVIDSAPAGAQVASWEQWAKKTREVLDRAADQHRRVVTAAARLRVERLSAIQAALGFTMQDLAAVLRLSRPQLYRWLDAADDVRMQDARRQRLATVERLAYAWRERSQTPLRSVARESLAVGGTLFARLSAEVIDEPAVQAAFDELAAKLRAMPKSLSQRLADAGFKRRPSIRSLPSDE